MDRYLDALERVIDEVVRPRAAHLDASGEFPSASVANTTGFFIESIADGSGATIATISNSIASDNTSAGIVVSGNASAPVKVSIDDVSVSGNSNNGVEADGQASVLLGRSIITGNGTGVQNNTSGNTFYSFGNNQIGLNGTDGSSSLNKATYTLQ